jgi:hypothetical protein
MDTYYHLGKISNAIHAFSRAHLQVYVVDGGVSCYYNQKIDVDQVRIFFEQLESDHPDITYDKKLASRAVQNIEGYLLRPNKRDCNRKTDVEIHLGFLYFLYDKYVA